jgi:hypothetical protein
LWINPLIPFLFVLSKERNILVARACYFISEEHKHIGLVRNVFAFFFRKFYFYFLISRIQLAFNNVCSFTIYDLSPTLA